VGQGFRKGSAPEYVQVVVYASLVFEHGFVRRLDGGEPSGRLAIAAPFRPVRFQPIRKTMTPTLDSSVASAHAPSTGVSLEVLCRRAERLIDSVRLMGEQVDSLLRRPDRAVADANDAADRLVQLRDSLDGTIEQARQAETSCRSQLENCQTLLPSIQQSAEALVQRVARARELSEIFAGLIESAADKIASIGSAADESRKARESIAAATQELARMQRAADHWAASVRQLSARQAEFIATGNATAARLRTLSDAGERLRESVRADIVALRELLRESRRERLAWEQLLARVPAHLPTAAEAMAPTAGRPATAALADRVRRLTDFIRQATEPPRSSPNADRDEAIPTRTL